MFLTCQALVFFLCISKISNYGNMREKKVRGLTEYMGVCVCIYNWPTKHI